MTALTPSHAGKNIYVNRMLLQRAGPLSHYVSETGSLAFCTQIQMTNIHILFAPQLPLSDIILVSSHRFLPN